jgi:GT2 family glycosyltransferase
MNILEHGAPPVAAGGTEQAGPEGAESVAATPVRATASLRGAGPRQESGYIDFYGHAGAAGGWIFSGWCTSRWPEAAAGRSIVAHFEHGRVAAEALTCWYERPDLGGKGIGVVIFLRAGGRTLGELVGLEVTASGRSLRLIPVRPVAHLREADVIGRVRPNVLGGSGVDRQRLSSLLARRVYAGADTLGTLPVPVHLEVDETVLAPPDGLVTLGWFLDPTDAVAAIRVRSGILASEPLSERWIRTERADVVSAFAEKYGALDARCGFVAVGRSCVAEDDALYAEVELKSGETGYKPLPRPVRSGNPAMRRVLESVVLAPDEIQGAFDRVLGPPLVAINRARLARPRKHAEITFGTPNPEPVCSVIVPLYGRIDFVMYQLALFSECRSWDAHELIYVLDDPPRKRELLDLAHSAHRRFGMPFRVVAIDENLGYGPANNVGLSYARGEFVCYLNSDVMPEEKRWLDLMVGDLRADPGLGMVGGLLLFEDGSVQHDGLTFERLPQLANWPFPMHPGKGRRLRAGAPDLEDAAAVTGACMVLRRELAQELGGFDEEYAIGDFEDSDLCMRIQAKGLRCAVDRRARLFHLERQSQVTPDRMWRMYVTLLNAWTHTNRWFAPKGAQGI